MNVVNLYWWNTQMQFFWMFQIYYVDLTSLVLLLYEQIKVKFANFWKKEGWCVSDYSYHERHQALESWIYQVLSSSTSTIIIFPSHLYKGLDWMLCKFSFVHGSQTCLLALAFSTDLRFQLFIQIQVAAIKMNYTYIFIFLYLVFLFFLSLFYKILHVIFIL